MKKEEYLNSDYVKMAHLNNQVVYLTQVNRRLEKENKQLKAQIEKMRRCQNCKNYYNKTKGGFDYCLFLHTCKNYDKWELEE